MSELIGFSVYDRKAGAFITPFFFPTAPMAERVFIDCVGDPDHMFSKHPEDYSLFQVFVFDTVSGDANTVELVELINGLQAQNHLAARALIAAKGDNPE